VCNLCSITTNRAAIIALFRVINRYVGNLPPMNGVFPDYPAPVIRNSDRGMELTTMRWGRPPPPRCTMITGPCLPSPGYGRRSMATAARNPNRFPDLIRSMDF